jgi:hypothetical protein
MEEEILARAGVLFALAARADAIAETIEAMRDRSEPITDGWWTEGTIKGFDEKLPRDPSVEKTAIRMLGSMIAENGGEVIELQHGERDGQYSLNVRLAA